MKPSLANRLEEIPGVASVVIDLEGFGRGIDVRLEEGADELAVMEKLRALLAAYGVHHDRDRAAGVERDRRSAAESGVDISITPLENGARVEVATRSVKSFRVVAATPLAVAQGLADAWCQVIGKVPVEIVSVSVGNGRLVLQAIDGEREVGGSAAIEGGWLDALAQAVGTLLGDEASPQVELEAS